MNTHDIKTYSQLKEYLDTLPEDMLEQNIAVELDLSEEVFSSSNEGARVDITGPEHSILDDNHLVIRVNY